VEAILVIVAELLHIQRTPYFGEDYNKMLSSSKTLQYWLTNTLLTELLDVQPVLYPAME